MLQPLHTHLLAPIATRKFMQKCKIKIKKISSFSMTRHCVSTGSYAFKQMPFAHPAAAIGRVVVHEEAGGASICLDEGAALAGGLCEGDLLAGDDVTLRARGRGYFEGYVRGRSLSRHG